MVRRKRDTQTLDLFEVPQPADPIPGAYDYRGVVSNLFSEMLRQAPGDRYAIAAEASRAVGKDISKWMLDAYSAESREEFNVPLWAVPAIEAACQSHDLTNWLVGVRGGRLLVGREALNAELGKYERIRDEAGRVVRALKKRMGESSE